MRRFADKAAYIAAAVASRTFPTAPAPAPKATAPVASLAPLRGTRPLLFKDLGPQPAGGAVDEELPGNNWNTRDEELLCEEWNITPSKLRSAEAEAAKHGFSDDRCIVFLIAKEVRNLPALADENNVYGDFNRRFTLITNPPNEKWKFRQETLRCILGMASIFEPDHGERTIPREISFDTFCERFPEWADKDRSFVFFRDHPSLHGNYVLIQRQQASDTTSGAVSSSVVLQHYLVAMGKVRPIPTPDMTKWFLKYAAADIVESLIFGGVSLPDRLLKSILIEGSLMYESAYDDIGNVLLTHGPLLLPKWAVTEEFIASNNKLNFYGVCRTSDDNRVGYHAMLAVGFRFCERTGKTYLLLQNWWGRKQFVEVDAEYYESCMASAARYVATPQPYVPIRGTARHHG